MILVAGLEPQEPQAVGSHQHALARAIALPRHKRVLIRSRAGVRQRRRRQVRACGPAGDRQAEGQRQIRMQGRGESIGVGRPRIGQFDAGAADFPAQRPLEHVLQGQQDDLDQGFTRVAHVNWLVQSNHERVVLLEPGQPNEGAARPDETQQDVYRRPHVGRGDDRETERSVVGNAQPLGQRQVPAGPEHPGRVGQNPAGVLEIHGLVGLLDPCGVQAGAVEQAVGGQPRFLCVLQEQPQIGHRYAPWPGLVFDRHFELFCHLMTMSCQLGNCPGTRCAGMMSTPDHEGSRRGMHERIHHRSS